MPTVKHIIEEIDKLRDELIPFLQYFPSHEDSLQDAKLKLLTNRIYEEVSSWGFKREAEEGFGRNSIVNMYDGVSSRAKLRDDRLKALRDEISSHPQYYETKLSNTASVESSSQKPPIEQSRKIFLGHGKNKVWARLHMHLTEDLHVKVEAWESDSRAGLHSVEVLKGLLDACTFAILVVTGDDSTSGGGLRARQNVVHEIGLFQGRLGFEKVALLEQEGVESFSNLAGLQVIRFPDERIEAAFYDLGRMLKRERVVV